MGFNPLYTEVRWGVYEAIRARCKRECQQFGGRLCILLVASLLGMKELCVYSNNESHKVINILGDCIGRCVECSWRDSG